MLAGRPHEAAGNGGPRWMTAAPRKRAHRTRPTGRLAPIHAPDLGLNGYCACWFRLCSVRAITKGRRLLESLPCPENIDHHVVVDPAKIRLLRHGLLPHSGGVPDGGKGDLDGAIERGMRALNLKRTSPPELLMVSRDLTKVLNERYSAESKTGNYLDQVAALTALILRQH
jgi:hypothetical protein